MILVFVDYEIFNYCKKCELRYSKEKGMYCPACGRQARSNPRYHKKNGKKIPKTTFIGY